MVLLCDFHREQAWERWVAKHSHGVTLHKEELLQKMRAVASASTRTEYDRAVAELKETNLWRTNRTLRVWFQETWLQECQASKNITMIGSERGPFPFRYEDGAKDEAEQRPAIKKSVAHRIRAVN